MKDGEPNPATGPKYLIQGPASLPLSSAPGKITPKTIEGIFRSRLRQSAKGTREPDLSRIDFEGIAGQLNRPWASDVTSDLWDVMVAVRTILDDGAKMVEAEQRHRSTNARKRAAAYALMVEAAEALRDSGATIPQKGETPPNPFKRQALSLSNPYHRDWKFVSDLVIGSLTGAGFESGKAKTSPAAR